MYELFGSANNDDDDGVNYDYLLRMPIYSLTHEKAELLRKQRDGKRDELDEVLGTPPKQMWSRDLDEFLIAYDEFEKEIAGASSASESTRNLTKTKSRTSKAAAKKKTTTKAAPKKQTQLELVVEKKKKAPKKAAPAKKKKEDAAPSFLDTSIYGGDDEDILGDISELSDGDLELLGMDDDALVAFSADKRAAPVARKPVAKTATLKRQMEADFDFIDEDDEYLQPIQKKPSPEEKKKAPAAATKKRAAAPVAKPARRATKKKYAVSSSEEEEADYDDEDEEVEEPSYMSDDVDEVDEFDEFDEDDDNYA